MVYVGIDVAKDKHDCYIVNSEGEVLAEVFTISNDRDGFNLLFQRLQSAAPDLSNVKVGLEATGHYSCNILGFLLDKGLDTCVFNPLHTNLFRKSTSLRRTKTDRVDARVIAAMMMSDAVPTSYTVISYHNEELKSLTRYRFEKVSERAKLKQSVSRLVNILFPELETLVPTLHMASVYAMLSEFPGAKQIAAAHLTHFKAVLSDASKGRYDRDKAVQIREAARLSIGSNMPAKALELQHTIRLIRELDKEIAEIEAAIKTIIDEMAPPILTIPGISYRMGAMILAEIGDFSRFDSPDKLLAYAGLSPSTYESGKLKATGAYAHMERQVRLPLGAVLRRLSRQEAGRRQALQRRDLSHCEEACAPYLCFTDFRQGISTRLISFSPYSSERPVGRSVFCTLLSSANSQLLLFWALTFNS